LSPSPPLSAAAKPVTDAPETFHQAAGQKDHNQHEQKTQRQVPAFADEQSCDRYGDVLGNMSGKKKEYCSRRRRGCSRAKS
jgi:hypothetical protein